MANPVARQVQGAPGFNAINVQTVEIFLQMSPNKPAGDVRGINTANFQVKDNTGAVIQNGTTPATGRIQMRVPGGVATLEVLAGVAVATYNVRIRNAAPEGITTLDGIRRRLRMLGYQIGHNPPPNGDGVDGTPVPDANLDRAILEFQADTPALNAAGNANAMDSIAGNRTQNALRTAAGV
jgi:hypothetical protein